MEEAVDGLRMSFNFRRPLEDWKLRKAPAGLRMSPGFAGGPDEGSPSWFKDVVLFRGSENGGILRRFKDVVRFA